MDIIQVLVKLTKNIYAIKIFVYIKNNIYLQDRIKTEINSLLDIKEIQTRINIETFPETILNCALPNKKGVTISTNNVFKYAPHVIHFYENELCKLVSTHLHLFSFKTPIL